MTSQRYLEKALEQRGETIRAAHDKRVTTTICPMTGFRLYYLDNELLMAEKFITGDSEYVDDNFEPITL